MQDNKRATQRIEQDFTRDVSESRSDEMLSDVKPGFLPNAIFQRPRKKVLVKIQSSATLLTITDPGSNLS